MQIISKHQNCARMLHIAKCKSLADYAMLPLSIAFLLDCVHWWCEEEDGNSFIRLHHHRYCCYWVRIRAPFRYVHKVTCAFVCTMLHNFSCCYLLGGMQKEREREKNCIMYFIVEITFYCACSFSLVCMFVSFTCETHICTHDIPLFYNHFKWLCVPFARYSNASVWVCYTSTSDNMRDWINALKE